MWLLNFLSCGFQLAQLVKSLVVEQGTWVQIPPTPKTNWCLGLMVRATIMNGRPRVKCYRNYISKKLFKLKDVNAFFFFFFLSFVPVSHSASLFLISASLSSLSQPSPSSTTTHHHHPHPHHQHPHQTKTQLV